MSEQSEALKERTMVFAINVLKLIDKFPNTPGAKVIAYQLAKCSTSVGANYRAVCNARSRAEFIARLGTVVEESEESVFWLRNRPSHAASSTRQKSRASCRRQSSSARSSRGLLARLEPIRVLSVAVRPLPKQPDEPMPQFIGSVIHHFSSGCSAIASFRVASPTRGPGTTNSSPVSRMTRRFFTAGTDASVFHALMSESLMSSAE